MVHDKIPVRHCWAHKIHITRNKVREADPVSVMADLHTVMNVARGCEGAFSARCLPGRWGEAYPAVVACLRENLHEILTRSKGVRMNDAIERRFLELRRRTRLTGRLPGQNLDGSRPLRRLHARKQNAGSPNPSPSDT